MADLSSVDYQLQIARQYGAPLDKYTVFSTLSEAEAYAKSPRAYNGQIVSVTEGEEVKLYTIDANGNLKEFVSSPSIPIIDLRGVV